jgi:glutamine amidotransferase PdxT
MKTIALERTENRISEALKKQHGEEPIVLTEGEDALGLLLRLPEGTKQSEIDGVILVEGPAGQTYVLIQAKCWSELGQAAGPPQPVFGSCNGMLTIVSDDEEHLNDFKYYME